MTFNNLELNKKSFYVIVGTIQFFMVLFVNKERMWLSLASAGHETLLNTANILEI